MKNNYLLAMLLALPFLGFAQTPLNLDTDAGVKIDPFGLCNPGSCTELHASYVGGKAADSYTVSAIPYQNLFPYTGGTVLNAACDDIWAPAFTLPFNFCFYGNTYNQILVGSNGVITFDLTGGGGAAAPCGGFLYCPWPIPAAPIPSTAFPIKNAIYSVYQDTDIRSLADGGAVTNPSVQNVNYYVAGVAPNRIFVANFNELPTFQCGAASGLQTTQVVLHETTNIIDIFIKKRTACISWNGGRGVVGIQNAAGTMAVVPDNRNVGNWAATNEAYRFMPSGASASSVAWYKNEVAFSTSNPVTVCPEEGDVFKAVATYTNCDGTTAVFQDEKTAHFNPVMVNDPVDLSICSSETMAAFDLTANIPIVLGINDPMNYEISFHASQADAENNAIPLANPENYMAANGTAIYMRVDDYTSEYGCSAIKSFQLNINTPPGQPTGNTEQFFTAGQTLADLEVNGTNITWYDQPIGGNALPSSTQLVDNTTYYASQTNASGCENTDRNAQATDRLPVTAYLTMGTAQWNRPVFEIKPNPVKDVLSISATQNITSISVYSLPGQRIMEIPVNGTSARLDFSKLAAGTYLVKIKADGYVKTAKVIRE